MKKIFKIVMIASITLTLITVQSISAQRGPKIDIKVDQISGYSDPSHPIGNIVDGNITSMWKSVPQNGYGDTAELKKETRMADHNRYINIKLDGLYNLDEIKIFNAENSSNNYYVYASEDGTNFEKIISKIDDELATSTGDTHSVNKKASYIRLNMAYNSDSFETNLAEIEVYGTKLSDTITTPEEIEVSSWEGSEYQKEWDKFESDKKYANSKAIKEIQGLVTRVIGSEWVSKFQFEIRKNSNGHDVFEIEDGNGVIIIRGNDGVSLASGFNYYLKNYAKVDYNPLFDSNTNMKNLVRVNKKIVKETQYDVRYALNFCTYSYTMAFWGWDEYQEFLDWAAMNGVNLVLDIVGQEEVLRQTLKQYNFTDEEIKEYIAGPGYFAWFYMQNLYSFGGPLPDNWFEQRVELGRKMHDRMQAYGIDPVIQGFSGQVPLTFDDKNEGAVLTPIDEWPSFTRPAIIKTYLSDEEIAAGKKDYFKDMAKVFYDVQKNVFGDVSNYYAADPFHEGGNTAGLDITNIFSTVQTEMLNNNENAIWVLQQWQGNLNANNLRGLVKPEQALALDLHANKNPEHNIMEKYNVPWVWNMLHNFGGRMGLDGDLEMIATQPAETMVKEGVKGMVGIGITPEALENSPIMYELLFDMTWESDPTSATKWVEKYAERRAGGSNEKLNEAWDILRETAYNQTGKFQGAAETVINARPGMNFSSASTWGHSSISYEKTELDKALKLLIENYDEFSASPSYRYDLADVAEQVLCNAAIEYHKLMVAAYNAGDSNEFKRISSHYLELISLSDKILGSTDEFMAGTWVNDAREMLDGSDDWTKDLFEFNARALITTWGGQRSNSLKDYSNRKWAGLTEEFYKERWEMWIGNKQAELDKTTKDPVAQKAESNWFLWEWKWVNRKSDDGFALSTTPDFTNLKESATTALEKFSTTSLKDFGSIDVEEDINIAEGKLFISDPATSEESRKLLTDGESESKGWEVNNGDLYTFTLDLEGTYEVNSIEILLQNLAKDFTYNYKVEIFNAVTNEWQLVKENAATDTMSRQTIVTFDKEANQEATQVRISMKTRDVAAQPLLITEFKVMGKVLSVPTYYNVAKGLLAESTRTTATGFDIKAITDDDIGNLWNSLWVSNVDSMYPTTVTLDLKNTYDVTSIELYLEKLELPYKFKVVTIDSAGMEEVVLDKTDNTTVLSDKTFKIPVNKSIKTVKVIYEGTTKNGPASAASPAMSELKVLSLSPQKEVDTKENHALNKPVTATSTQSTTTPEAMNDGNTATWWNFNGYAATTANVEIDLQGTFTIEDVNLQFRKETNPKYYAFDVYVIDKDGNKNVVHSEGGIEQNQEKYTLNVNKDIKKVGVDFKGKKAGTDGWFDIVELEAIGYKSKVPNFVFGQGQITSVTTDSSYKNAIDGNETTFITGIKDKEIVFNFDTEYYLDKVELTFEKGELGLHYIVYVENSDGTRSVVSDASNSMGILGNKTISLPVNRNAKKVIFKHLGNNGDGPSYLADPRLYEAAFFMGTPADVISNSTLSNAAAGNINDGNPATSHTMNQGEIITFTLEKATDINIIQLQGSLTKTRISDTFKVEAFNVTTKEWEVVYEGLNDEIKNEYMIVLDKSVYTNEIRLTALATKIEVAEFKVYEVDLTQPLVAYIKEVRTLLDSKRYDDNNGSYRPEEKEKIETLLTTTEAKLQKGMSSVEIDGEMEAIKQAVKEFETNGIIYVDRSALLSNINYAKVVLAEAEQVSRSLEEAIVVLKEKVIEAETLYKLYEATQTSINELNTVLGNAISTVYIAMDVDTKFNVQTQMAEDLLAAGVGDKHGQVSQTIHDELAVALKKANTDFISGNIDKLTVLNELETAIAIFNSNKIVVDKVDLLASLDMISTLVKSDYDFTTWTNMQAVFTASKTVYDTELVSQAEVDAAITNLENAVSALVRLDKTELRTLLDSVSSLNESQYTVDSWKKLMEVYAEANTLYVLDELTQAQVDAMHNKLNDAKTALINKPTPPSEEGDNPNEGDRPNEGGTPNSGNNNESNSSGSGADTGDTTNRNGWILLMLLSAGVLVLRKKVIKNK